MYDIDQLLVPQSALDALNLQAAQLVDGATVVADDTLPELVQRHSYVMNF